MPYQPKDDGSPISRAMMTIEDGKLNIGVLDTDKFNADSGGVQPTIEIRFYQMSFSDYVRDFQNELAKPDNTDTKGAFLFKRVNTEYYIQPCGNEKFMQLAEQCAEKLNMPIVR